MERKSKFIRRSKSSHYSRGIVTGFKSSQKNLSAMETVNKRGAGRRHDYLYVHSPGGAFRVTSFQSAVISLQNVNDCKLRCMLHSVLEFQFDRVKFAPEYLL